MTIENFVQRIIEVEGRKDVVHVKNFGKEYIASCLFYSEIKIPEFSEVFGKAVESFEKKYGVKVKCTKEAVDWLDYLRIAGGSKERYIPPGHEIIVEEYKRDEEAVKIGKIINYLERNMDFDEDKNLIII